MVKVLFETSARLDSCPESLQLQTLPHLLGHFREEELRQLFDAGVLVHQAEGQIADLPLDLDHIVEDQVCQNHHRRLANMVVRVLRRTQGMHLII